MKFVHSPLLSQALPVWRARLLLLGLLAGFVALALYSLYLQSFNSGFLQEKGASRYSRVIELSATRGRITDRHGEALAVSTPVKSIWAIPEDAKLQPAQARELAGMLEMDVSELSQKLATGKEFVYVKRQIAPDVAEKIAALNLKDAANRGGVVSIRQSPRIRLRPAASSSSTPRLARCWRWRMHRPTTPITA